MRASEALDVIEHGTGHAAHDATPRTRLSTALVASRPAETAQGVKLPHLSTRGDAPGPRGCWALNKRGEGCGAARRADSDYCNAHSGIGIVEDPTKWSAIASAKSAENRRRRATLRLALGVTKANTPRGVLKAAAFAESEAIAGRVIGAVLDPATPSVSAARLGLDLINSVDPPVVATVTTPLPSDPEGVSTLSMSQLFELGERLGIDPSPVA